MFGMIGSLLGSVASGLFGMAGQSSANEANKELDSTKYQRASADMQAAGLNPAAMYNGGTPAGAPVMQSTMAAPAAAMKDAAQSATAQMIAQKTIDHLTEQIAKTNAESANIKAGTPGIAARSYLDTVKSDAVRKIPDAIRLPLNQAGYGADIMKSTGQVGAIGGGVAASAKSAKDGVVEMAPGYHGPNIGSAKEAIRAVKRKYDSFPSYTEAEREAARQRNKRRWGWLTGEKPTGSTQYQQ